MSLKKKNNQITKELFQNTVKTYKNNLQTIKNLKKGTTELINKSYNITKKKAEIEDEFTI